MKSHKHKKRNSILYLLILVLSMTIFNSCHSAQNTSISKSGFYLNTIINIKLYNTDNEALLSEGLNLCKKYDALFSKTDERSDVYKLNHSSGEAVTVSNETIYLIEQGIQYAKLTNGKFNIAIGAVSELWDFTSGTAQLPLQADLDKALTTVDYNKIMIDGNSVTIPSGMKLDLGAIAKGYIGDKLKEFYVKKGITSALLNLGGNIVCIGTSPDNDAFHIGIKKPFTDTESIAEVYIDDACVVTSGIYERYFEKNDVMYHHILDSTTGYPVKTDLYSASIIADNSMEADILSTACLMLGKEKAQEFLKQFKTIKAILVTDNYKVIHVN